MCNNNEYVVLSNWINEVRDNRNACAHHEHLFSRFFTNNMLIPQNNRWININRSKKFGSYLCLLNYILHKIPDQEAFIYKLNQGIKDLVIAQDKNQKKKTVYVNIPKIMGISINDEY